MVDLLSPFTGSGYTNAANAQISGINAGLSGAIPQYQDARLYSDTLYGQAYPYWMQNLGTATQGVNAYGNATGAGGAAGTDQAVADFWKSPQLASQLKAGNAAELARQAAIGGTGSGSEAYALHNLDLDIAGKGWQNYVSNLAQFLPYSTANTAGVSTTLGNQAALGVPQYNRVGDATYGAATSIGNANANAALGQQTAAQNIWNLGTNLLGGFLGGGGPQKVASGITSLFGS